MAAEQGPARTCEQKWSIRGVFVQVSRGVALVVSIETDDLHPIRAFSRRILLPQRPARLVDRIDRDCFRPFSGGDEEPSLGINRESARLALGGRTSELEPRSLLESEPPFAIPRSEVKQWGRPDHPIMSQ